MKKDEEFITQIEPSLRKQMKEQRLRAIQQQYFDFYMQKVALEASELTAQAQSIAEKMIQTKSSYDAVNAIVIEEPAVL